MNNISYNFCGKKGHGNLEMNMICLNLDCADNSLLCAMCLFEDQNKHSSHKEELISVKDFCEEVIARKTDLVKNLTEKNEYIKTSVQVNTEYLDLLKTSFNESVEGIKEYIKGQHQLIQDKSSYLINTLSKIMDSHNLIKIEHDEKETEKSKFSQLNIDNFTGIKKLEMVLENVGTQYRKLGKKFQNFQSNIIQYNVKEYINLCDDEVITDNSIRFNADDSPYQVEFNNDFTVVTKKPFYEKVKYTKVLINLDLRVKDETSWGVKLLKFSDKIEVGLMFTSSKNRKDRKLRSTYCTDGVSFNFNNNQSEHNNDLPRAFKGETIHMKFIKIKEGLGKLNFYINQKPILWLNIPYGKSWNLIPMVILYKPKDSVELVRID
jgi:hypothetical protein